ncbi:MAG: hypothetical protein ACJAQ3_000937 [Planctomycetota bacterium]|jgi:hypothetical protein
MRRVGELRVVRAPSGYASRRSRPRPYARPRTGKETHRARGFPASPGCMLPARDRPAAACACGTRRCSSVWGWGPMCGRSGPACGGRRRRMLDRSSACRSIRRWSARRCVVRRRFADGASAQRDLNRVRRIGARATVGIAVPELKVPRVAALDGEVAAGWGAHRSAQPDPAGGRSVRA